MVERLVTRSRSQRAHRDCGRELVDDGARSELRLTLFSPVMLLSILRMVIFLFLGIDLLPGHFK